TATSLGGCRQPGPGIGDAVVIRDHGTSIDPGLQSGPILRSPAPDLGPLPQFGHGDEGEPYPVPDDVAVDPTRRSILLQDGRNVGVDNDVGHVAQAGEALRDALR